MLELGDMFYFANINEIGGVETFFYQIARQYNDRDITIVYKAGDLEQIKRLIPYVRVIKYKNEKIKCEKSYFNYNTDIIDSVEAKEYIGLIHSDYKNIPYTPNVHPKLNRFIAVSQNAKNSFEELTGKKCEVIYNPYRLFEKPKRVLKLVSATRLTREKGKERMTRLGEELNKLGTPYIWVIFTNDIKTIDNPNIVYMKPRLDIIDYIAEADYLVQLSDAEAFCYSIVEALSVNTPVIVTNLPVLKEIGVSETNSFILDFDLSNLDVQRIYKEAGKFKFSYLPPKSDWDKEITKNKSNYKEELKMRFKVEALPIWKERNITCTDLNNKIPKLGEQWEVDKERLNVLLGDNPHNQPFVKLVEEVKPVKEVKKETNEDKPKKTTTKKQPKKVK